MARISADRSQKLAETLLTARRLITEVGIALSPDFKVQSELSLATVAQRLLEQRRARSAVFAGDLFGEPAWDLLLVLFIAHQRGDTLRQAAAWQAAGLSDATAARWVTQLEGAGLVVRKSANVGGRERLVELTSDGVDRMTDYLTSIMSLASTDAPDDDTGLD